MRITVLQYYLELVKGNMLLINPVVTISAYPIYSKIVSIHDISSRLVSTYCINVYDVEIVEGMKRNKGKNR